MAGHSAVMQTDTIIQGDSADQLKTKLVLYSCNIFGFYKLSLFDAFNTNLYPLQDVWCT